MRRVVILYFLLALSIAFAGVNNILYHKLSEEKKAYNQFVFTAVSSLVWLVAALPNKSIIHINATEVMFGVMYGVVQAMFLFFKMKAMSSGPVSITSVVSNCSMLLTTLLGVIIFRESCSWMQIIGVLMILVSVFLCIDPKSGMEMTIKWKLYCALFFIFAASVGIIFKFFAGSSGNANNMMSVSAMTMIVVLAFLSFLSKQDFKLTKKQTMIAVLCGVVSFGYNRINIFLSGALPSVVFFPIFNGAIVLFSTVAGSVIFKERFSFKQLCGIIAGVLAIVLIGGVFDI